MILLLLGITIALLGLRLYLFPLRERLLPYRNLPGPKPTSTPWGNLLDLAAVPVGDRYKTWMHEYGATLRFRGFLGKWRIVSSDVTAVAYVLRHTGQFHRHGSFNGLIQRMVGDGVLCVEGEQHRRQRRVLNSAFNGISVNNMIGMMWEEAAVLKDSVGKTVETQFNDNFKGAEIDMLNAYTCTAMDLIGRAGFAYRFDSHVNHTNPLSSALTTMVNAWLENKLAALVQSVFPAALNFPTPTKAVVDKARISLDKVGSEIVAERKREIERDHISLEKDDYEGKDVISLCLRANMLASERDKLTDAEVLGQIGTLMVAGNETTATALSWATYHFCNAPEIQQRLRDECSVIPNDEPSAEELNSLPYLDKFIKELLRFDPPLPQVVRQATEDAVIPLSKPVIGRNGAEISEIQVSKGTDIVIPIARINRMQEIWGADAESFNPDRFDNPALPYVQVPGVFGNLLSFNGGPHNCLGYRFALLELKVVLFMIIRNFSFEFIPNGPRIKRVAPGVVQRPVIIGRESEGIKLPVLVRKVEG